MQIQTNWDAILVKMARVGAWNVQFQKISVLSPTEGIGISCGVGGSVMLKKLKKCMNLNWNLQRGGGGLRKNPFRGGGMDIFWNYTINPFNFAPALTLHNGFSS